MEIAFLRGINVGGSGVVLMADLRRAFEDAGCQNVRTYIQTGNVIFECAGSPASTRRAVVRKVSELLKSPAVIAFRTARALKDCVADDLFSNIHVGKDDKCCVVFLTAKAASPPALPVRSAKDGLDVFAALGDTVFVVRRKVSGRYGYPNDFVEKLYGVAATTRNWSTVAKVAALLT